VKEFSATGRVRHKSRGPWEPTKELANSLCLLAFAIPIVGLLTISLVTQLIVLAQWITLWPVVRLSGH